MGGSLYLGGTRITALPDTLTVRGSLNLSGTGITALPDKLTVGGRVHGLEDNQPSKGSGSIDNIEQEKHRALVCQCTEEIQQTWKTFYNIHDTSQKKNPFFQDKPLPLAFLIEQFTMEGLESVRGKYPFARAEPGSLLWSMVFEAISRSGTCSADHVKEALEQIQKKYSA